MPYKIIWEDNGVEVQFSGVFDFEANKNANYELYDDPRCENINFVIWNTSGISAFRLTESEFSMLALQDYAGSSRVHNLKLAILLKDKQTARLFDYYACNYNTQKTEWEVKVFESMEQLRSWIAS